MQHARATLGLLVGGHARRMNGAAKGLLTTESGETIVARTARIFEAFVSTVVLLGARADYDLTGLASLRDEPDAEGPLAGLLALLRRATTSRVYLVGGDMPFVSAGLIARLAGAAEAHPAVAFHDGERYFPLFSAFDGDAIRLRVEAAVTGGARSPSAVLRAVDAARLTLDEGERDLLRDWDTPEDVGRPI